MRYFGHIGLPDGGKRQHMVVTVFGVGYPDEKVAPIVGRQSLRISVNIKRYLGNGGRVRIDYTAVRGINFQNVSCILQKAGIQVFPVLRRRKAP